MFERVISALGNSGVTEAVVSLGFKPEAFTNAFPDGNCAGVKLTYAIEPEPLDTAGAIAFAAREAGVDDTFLVVNGDVLTDLNYASVVEAHKRFGGQATIHLTPVEDPSRFGVVPTDEDGRVIEFVEKPEPGTEPTNQINAGTYVMEPSVLDHIEAGRRVSVERETFPTLAEAGTLYAMSTSDYWLDAGTPAAYIQANLDMAFGKRTTLAQAVSPTSDISPGATVEGSVIGDGVVIAEGADVRGSVLMEGAVVQSHTVVTDSVIAAGATVGEKSNLSEFSVVGFGAHCPDGTVLSGGTHPDKSEWAV